MINLVSKLKPMTNFGLILISSVVLGGCATHYNFERVEAPPVDESWSTEHGATTSSKSSATQYRWWEEFNDPTMALLVERVYQQNLTLRVAALRILEARALLGVARSELYPAVNSKSAVTRSGPSGNAQPSDSPFTNYQSSIDTTWELDLWGRVRNKAKAASADLNALDAAYEDAALSIGAEVASTYIRYHVIQNQIVLVQQNIALQQESLRIAKSLLEDGSRNALDVEQARAVLADTHALIPDLIRARTLERNALITLLSLNPSELEQFLPNKPNPIPQITERLPMGVPADLLRRRPDLRRAESVVIAAAARAGVAEVERYPRLSLNGSLFLQVTDGVSTLFGGGPGDFFDSDSFGFNVGPAISIPLFNAGALKKQWLAKDAVLQQALELYRLAVLRSLQDVENAQSALVQSTHRNLHLTDSAQAYQKALDIAKILYEEGDSDFQSIIDTQRQLVLQQRTQLTEQGNISLAQIALIRALGGGWIPDEFDRLYEGTRRQMLNRVKHWREHIETIE